MQNVNAMRMAEQMTMFVIKQLASVRVKLDGLATIVKVSKKLPH